MPQHDVAEEPLLEIQYQNRRRIELLDLTNSLSAVAQQYNDLAKAQGAKGGQLYVHHFAQGSIIAKLLPLLEQASSFLDQRDTLAAFMAGLNDLFRYFREFSVLDPKAVSRRQARQVQRILKPTVSENGSQVNVNLHVEGDLVLPITVKGDLVLPGNEEGDLQVPSSIKIGSDEARVINGNIRDFLQRKPPPDAKPFEKAALNMTRIKDERRSRSADLGIISSIWPHSLELSYRTNRVRRDIVETSENPFRLLYVVDGVVHLVDGEPVRYEISRVWECFEDPEALI